MTLRIGHGFDVHRFDLEASGPQSIKLGGVGIPSDYPVIAHSDGDVLIHALCDALLGALGLGDIGEHFPDTDAAFKDADSRQLLREVMQLVTDAGWRIGNIDITVIAQAPKVSPHKQQMRETIARDLHCSLQQLNLKATTTEGLGYTGRREGIACHVVALLEQDTELADA